MDAVYDRFRPTQGLKKFKSDGLSLGRHKKPVSVDGILALK